MANVAISGEVLDKNSELVLVAKESGLAETKVNQLLQEYGEYFTSALNIIHDTQDMEVTSEDQKAEIEQAGIARKELKRLRCEAENTRKRLKEDALREGQTIDKMASVIKTLIKPEEERLEQMEKIAERMAAERQAKKVAERRNKLAEYVATPSLYKFEHISDEDFAALIKQLDDDRKAKQEAERVALEAEEARRKQEEAERAAREKAAEEERKRIEAENAKLKAEAEAREAELAKQRAEQEKKLAEERAKAEEERKKREAIEAEQRAKAEAEEKAKAEAEEKARQALLAPDKEKLLELAASIEAMQLPALSNKNSQAVLNNVETLLGKVSTYIRDNVKGL